MDLHIKKKHHHNLSSTIGVGHGPSSSKLIFDLIFLQRLHQKNIILPELSEHLAAFGGPFEQDVLTIPFNNKIERKWFINISTELPV